MNPTPSAGAEMADAISHALQQYQPTDAAIAEIGERYALLEVHDPDDEEGFARVREARLDVKGLRTSVERTRKDLKADALEYGRRVDAEAKRLTGLLLPIETRLKEMEDAVKAKREEIAAAEAEAERARMQARVDEMAALGSDAGALAIISWDEETWQQELAAARAVHAEHEARAAAEQAEREVLEAQRAAEREAREAEERAAREAEAAAQAAERARIEKLEAELNARAAEVHRREQELEAARRAEEAEARAREQAEREAEAEKARAAEAERLRPQREQIRALAETLRKIQVPAVDCAADLAAIIFDAATEIEELAL